MRIVGISDISALNDGWILTGWGKVTQILDLSFAEDCVAVDETAFVPIEKELKRYGRWNSNTLGSRDLFGGGGIRIDLLDNKNLYLFQFHRSVDQGDFEAKVAKQINAPVAVWNHSVVVKVEPSDKDRFDFDFDRIFSLLKREICPIILSAEEMARTFMIEYNYLSGEIKPIVLYKDNCVQLSLDLGCIGKRFDEHLENDRWEMEGSTIRGPLVNSGVLLPTLVFRVESSRRDNYGRSMPILEKDEEAAKNLTAMIVDLISAVS